MSFSIDWTPLNVERAKTVGELAQLVQRQFQELSNRLDRARNLVQLQVQEEQRANFTAKERSFYPVDPSPGAFSITLPSTKRKGGSVIIFAEVGGSTNTLTFLASGEQGSVDTIAGSATSSTANAAAIFLCDESQQRWVRLV